MLFALAWGRRFGKKIILFSESTEADCVRFPWKERLKSYLVKQYGSALVGGKPQKRYMVKLGMPEEAIFFGYNVVGNDTFHPGKIRQLPRPLAPPYFLTINRFIPKKNLPFLIDAYAAYRHIAGHGAWHLVLCGDGPLGLQLEQQINTLGLGAVIHLPGFLQQEDLLPYFAHASCFIHASTHEPWGLVVNEAMAAGLPVLVSNRCGCFEDLVIEGLNGFGFDPENQHQLVNLMVQASSRQVDLTAMGQASLVHIQNYDPAYFAQGLKQAIDYVTS
ncbi:MAG: glycosyltransferase [Nodosilinea sp.]